MMVETILESSQDLGMSNGALPQWKRELLQRRAARSRPSPPAPPAPPSPPAPPPPPADDSEELRYGPGIVKRLKSRYLSLALRDAPRRRPSVLRRAASLEHLLDERPPPAARPPPAPRQPRPASLAPLPPAASPRREAVKRARSVDALSRLEARDEPQPPSPSPPPPRPPPQPRAARPPRRPAPLLRETERPPPDVVRSTLRKFESAPPRRAAPAARVSAVLRGLEPPQWSSTPEPPEHPWEPNLAARSPSPVPAGEAGPTAPGGADEPEGAAPSGGARVVSRAALEGIARAGSSVRYSFAAPPPPPPPSPLAATNPVLAARARRVGIIRPMPPLDRPDTPPRPTDDAAKLSESESPLIPLGLEPTVPTRIERREAPPSALVEPLPRMTGEVPRAESPGRLSPILLELDPPPETKPEPESESTLEPKSAPEPRVASEAQPAEETKLKESETLKPVLVNGHCAAKVTSRIGAAGIERAWSGSGPGAEVLVAGAGAGAGSPWARGSPGAGRRARGPPPASTSVVFNFSNRKEVPDYIENDGLILRASRRNRFKAGEAGVVVLRAEGAGAGAGGGGAGEDEPDSGPPSPCAVHFVNDNVLINGRSSMPHRPDKDRIAKLKLQFDDSLTRTFEYPSEASLGADEAERGAPLAANTHIASAALSRYTPSKTAGAAFQLGLARPLAPGGSEEEETSVEGVEGVGAGAGGEGGEGGEAGEAGDARPCGADVARSWSEARTHHTDLLF